MSEDNFISMSELYPIYKELADDELIVDVRTAEEFEEGHVPGSDHIPYEQIADKAAQYAEYNKVYIYCRRGMRAQRAYEILKDEGLDNLVCVSDGGMDEWVNSGYPIED